MAAFHNRARRFELDRDQLRANLAHFPMGWALAYRISQSSLLMISGKPLKALRVRTGYANCSRLMAGDEIVRTLVASNDA